MNRRLQVLIFVLAALVAAGSALAQTPAGQGQAAPTQAPSAPSAAPQGVPAQAGQPAVSQAQPAADAKGGKQAPAKGKKAAVVPVVQPVVPPPPGYVIGPDDILVVLFRYDKDLTTEVGVRPDGMISLPMLSDIQAAGLTPEQLRDRITENAKRFIEDPSVTVIVKTINSRKVFITGQVAKPGPYPLMAPTTVLQLIAMAGGLTEFADQGNISILRTENGKPSSFAFNYKDVTKRKKLQQNIELKPGDTVIVP